MEVCVRLMEAGLLAKPTHDTTIRMAPPLILDRAQIDEQLDIIERVLLSF